jgi:cytochrome c-type biogenesis protein CcmH/NrfF
MTRPGPISAIFLCFLTAMSALLGVASYAQQTDRARQIGGKFMCMCGCNQVLTQCNHVGCTASSSMLKELDQSVARGDSETAITQAFVQEFGTKVYAEPPKSGLSLVVWTLPSLYLFAGTIVVILVIWRWRARFTAPLTPAAGMPAGISQDDLQRARRQVAQETED